MSDKKLLWSPLPPGEYSIEFQGALRGIGLHPAFTTAPGAWNLLWLITGTQLADLLNWDEEAGKFPASSQCLHACVGAALQLLDITDPRVCFGDLAESLTPKKFLEESKSYEDFLLTKLYGEAWITSAEENAAEYEARHDNVLQGNFRR